MSTLDHDKEGRPKVHPAANLFPMMDAEALGALALDIERHGLRFPIILHKGAILDGRNRYEACQEAGREPRYEEWDGTGGSPTLFVLSLNAFRRHLTPSQKAMIAAEALPLLEAEAKERQRAAAAATNAKRRAARDDAPADAGGTIATSVPLAEEPAAASAEPERRKARDDAAKAVGGVSPRYVQDAKQVQDQAPDLADAVKAGEITLPEAKRKIKQAEIKKRAAEVQAATPVAPRAYTSMEALTWAVSGGDEKPFGCIYADPPWNYENQGTRGATDNEYVTMDLAAIKALPVESIAADDAHLCLWATSPLLPEAFDVMRAWGFTYKCALVWDKSPRFGLGNRFRICTEYLIVGIRGKPDWLRADVPSIYRGEAGKHSAKPAAIRDLVESCTVGPHVELFAREVAPRWAAMGNELVAAEEAR